MSSSARASLAGVSAHEESNIYTSDYSVGTDGNASAGGVVAGNIDTNADAAGQPPSDNWLRFTVDAANTTHYFYKAHAVIPASGCVRLRFKYYIPSTNSHLDGIKPNIGTAFQSNYATLDAETAVDIYLYFSADSNATSFFATDGGVTTFQDAGGDDVFYIKDFIMDRWTRNPNV